VAADRRFLILHGWQNHRPAGHWQRWLAEELRATGEDVLYPQLPDPDEPTLPEWLGALRAELGRLCAGDGERVVIAHSLGCLLWLRHAERAPARERVDRVLLVCPAGPAALPESLRDFYDAPLDRNTLRDAARSTELVCTDADPWCPEGAAAYFGRALDLPTHVVAGGGHLSLDEGYGAWPAVAAWARTGRFPVVEGLARAAA
jgi:predicted alpha/beta hydrolase family esterase